MMRIDRKDMPVYNFEEPIKEVCEWEKTNEFWVKTKCSSPTNGMNLFDAREFNCCPYCTKPISIKGE